jgi:hypothetical protein
MECHSVVNLLYKPLYLCKLLTKECRKFNNSNLHLICTPNVHVTIPMSPYTSKFKNFKNCQDVELSYQNATWGRLPLQTTMFR